MTGFKPVEIQLRLSVSPSRGITRHVWLEGSFFGLSSCALCLVLLS